MILNTEVKIVTMYSYISENEKNKSSWRKEVYRKDDVMMMD